MPSSNKQKINFICDDTKINKYTDFLLFLNSFNCTDNLHMIIFYWHSYNAEKLLYFKLITLIRLMIDNNSTYLRLEFGIYFEAMLQG